jgi:hypothetical protein
MPLSVAICCSAQPISSDMQRGTPESRIAIAVASVNRSTMTAMPR